MRLTYAKCAELLGTRERKKLAGNTYLSRIGDGSYGVVFHRTIILRYWSDGRCEVSSGGYQTVTTKSRLNEFGPFNVWQAKGVWYCKVGGAEVRFVDCMTVDVDGYGDALCLSERVALTRQPEERALVASVWSGDCPAGVVTDWRKENGLIPV